MFKTTALDSVANRYVDKNVGTSTPGTRIEADDNNIEMDELVNAVESSGQTLDPTGVKVNQLARFAFLNGVGAQSMVDSGTANAKVLTPVTGASGYVVGENYTHLSGAVLIFKIAVTNTGATTVDVGQTAGTLLGVKSLTQPGGAALVGGELVAGDYASILYDLANDRFEVVTAVIKESLLTTQGDFIVRGASIPERLAAGAVGTVLAGKGAGVLPAYENIQDVSEIPLKCTVVDIGDWNMDATISIQVAHGLTLSNIRNINVVVRDDADSIHIPLNYGDVTALGVPAGDFNAQSTDVYLARDLGGFFDNANYDATSYNRGWITIWHV